MYHISNTNLFAIFILKSKGAPITPSAMTVDLYGFSASTSIEHEIVKRAGAITLVNHAFVVVRNIVVKIGLPFERSDV
jgi:hypothetical protein